MRWFSTVCLLRKCLPCKWSLQKTQPTTINTKYQQTHKICSEVVKFEISSAKSFCSQACFLLAAACILDTFVITKASHKRKSRTLHKLASLRRSVSFRDTCHGARPLSGRSVVRASHFHSAKIKICKNFF